MSIIQIPTDIDISAIHPRVIDLFKKPQYAQRTPEWYEVRKTLMIQGMSSRRSSHEEIERDTGSRHGIATRSEIRDGGS